jgi:hypothetical protein
MTMKDNTALNGFLALIEGRDETAREMLYQAGIRRDIGTVYGRIQQTVENIKARAVRDAVRKIYRDTLRLQPKHQTPNEVDLGDIDLDEAYLEGVQDVEAILAEVLKKYEEEEKHVGPQTTVVP